MADTYIIGPGPGKSQVQQFHDFLLSEVGNIPLATQWVLQIDQLPAALETNLSSNSVRALELGNWLTADRALGIKRAINDGAFLDKGICMFAQGAQTPREGLTVQRIGPNEGFQGGLLGAPVSQGRNTLQELNIAFLETNYSFLDFVIRPWIVYVSHYGLIARLPTDPRNVKTTLQLFFYDRGGKNLPKVRKVFRFYNAAPVLTEGIISTWDDQEVKKIYTSWTYTHYDVATESVAGVLANIRTTTFNTLTKLAGISVPSLPSLPALPLPFGSEFLSNPTSFDVGTAFKTVGGAVIGGSHATNLANIFPGGI